MTAVTITPTAPKLATDADRIVGSRIAALRVAQGLSQSALGSALGVSFQQVQKYEKGRNRIGAGRLQAIADVLRVPVETFFTRQSESTGSHAGPATFLEDPQAMELVMAFARIRDTATRASVVAIVKATAGLQPEPDRD